MEGVHLLGRACTKGQRRLVESAAAVDVADLESDVIEDGLSLRGATIER